MKNDLALHDFFNDLRKVSKGDVRTDDYSLILYSTDASIYQVKPLGVLIPKTIDDVQAAVELAHNYKIPVLPRTGGSSLAGQAVNEALVIDMSKHLNHMLEVNKQEQWVRVQPGLVLDVLNNNLQSYGLQFGPDPASSNRAAMGGIVANNSTGAHSILYGMTADHVLETEVILSDGSQARFTPLNSDLLRQKQSQSDFEGRIYSEIATLTTSSSEIINEKTPHHWRRSGGYNLDRFINGPTFKYPQNSDFNLANLICGSEGTLAVMHEIKLNLVPRPKMTALGIVHFDSLYDALSTTPAILEVDPSAIELLDNYALTLCLQLPAYSKILKTFLRGNPNCLLITEFFGDSEVELRAKIEKLTNHLDSKNVKAEVVPAIDPELQNNVWTVRKVGLGLLMSIKGDFKPIPFIEDAAVPPEHLADYVTNVEKFCNDLGTKVAYYAHASAGCLHIRPLINAKLAKEVDKLPEIAQFSVELLGQYGGSLSSEHGDGRSRSWLNEHFFGKELYGLYKNTKQIFDPENILNPGIVVEAEAMTENLRFGATYSVNEITEKYDFSEDQGFHRAVEMCNGAGICRKTTMGTMCPSFMVTGDEEHSTRGRANALRAALSGTLDFSEFTSKRMFEVMDLCVECKACKAECPSMVDMAKIKFEFLAHYYEQHRVPLRTRIFANIRDISRLSSGSAAKLANWINSLKLTRLFLDTFLRISKHRQLPAFSKEPFTVWYQKNRNQKNSLKKAQQVVLFPDTFNNYQQPGVLRSALEILEAVGYEVLLPEPCCCGRSAISKGMFDQAKSLAEDAINKLHPFALQGIPIVGLEPGCLLTLREENLWFFPNDNKAQLVADNSFLFEEFIVGLKEKGKLNLPLSEDVQEILLHGHCHQKSVVGTGPVTEMLSLPVNYRVKEVDSGCCGMAGSFGYEKEHYDISMQMAERKLLPAIREQSEETIIAASGFSYRHQVSDGSGRTALHPAEILRQALVEEERRT
jgi:FAD/FMN-containing dehydrogenase/Fe-S oxidoreductase